MIVFSIIALDMSAFFASAISFSSLGLNFGSLPPSEIMKKKRKTKTEIITKCKNEHVSPFHTNYYKTQKWTHYLFYRNYYKTQKLTFSVLCKILQDLGILILQYPIYIVCKDKRDIQCEDCLWLETNIHYIMLISILKLSINQVVMKVLSCWISFFALTWKRKVTLILACFVMPDRRVRVPPPQKKWWST